MRILRLDLTAFGPFTDRRLDLSKGRCGFHLIFGPNEAGKSSAMEALRQLLFGIDERTSYDFVHEKRKLRLGGHLQHSDGRELEFVRLKGRKVTLTTADGLTSLPAEELAHFLDGVDRAQFERKFTINHAEVIGFMNETAKGGNLSDLMFGASLGGTSGIRTLQEQLQSEMDALYRPAGRKQKINEAIGELREMDRIIRETSLSSSEYVGQENDLKKAESLRSELDLTKQSTRSRLKKLERVAAALKLVPRRRHLIQQLQECAGVPLLPDDFGGRCRRATQTFQKAHDRAEHARQELQRLNDHLSTLAVPQGTLDVADDIEALQEQLGIHKKAQTDRPRLVGVRQGFEHEAKEILRNLGRPGELKEAENLRLNAEQEIRFRHLANQQLALIEAVERGDRDVQRWTNRLQQTNEQLNALPESIDVSELRSLVQRIQSDGPLEKQLADLASRHRRANDTAQKSLASLPLWRGSLAEVELLPVPIIESIERFDQEQLAIERRKNSVADQLAIANADVDGLTQDIERLQAEGQVPTETDLASARHHREIGWQLILEAWQLGKINHAEEAAFVAASGRTDNLTRSYETSVERADNVADRLRHESDRVTRLVALQTELDKKACHRDQLGEQLAVIQTDSEVSLANWRQLWAETGIVPHSSKEMRAWLQNLTELRRQSKEATDLGRDVQELQGRIAAHLRNLRTALARFSPPSNIDSSLTFALEQAHALIKRAEELERNRLDLERLRDGITNDIAVATSELEVGQARLQQWQNQWSDAVRVLGLQPDATPDAVSHYVTEIRTLGVKLRDADGNRRRIEGIDRDSAEFVGKVRQLTGKIAPNLASSPVEEVCSELRLRLKSAIAVQQEFNETSRRQAEEEKKLHDADSTLREARVELELLCREAGVADESMLMEAEQLSSRRRHLEKDVTQINDDLLGMSTHGSLDSFLNEVEQSNSDSIDNEINKLGNEITQLEDRASELDRSIGSQREKLNSMRVSEGAAAKAFDRAAMIAATQTDIEKFVRLFVAQRVLQESIDRFRKKNENTILVRTGELFSRLTAGSFERVQVDFDDKEEPFLFGLRAGTREPVVIDGLSDGSRDQLYLALRIADLENYLKAHEPLPLVLDDILLNYDDDRATAALQVLADLSDKTQVIAFTHHRHLADLAKQCVSADSLLVHMLTNTRT